MSAVPTIDLAEYTVPCTNQSATMEIGIVVRTAMLRRAPESLAALTAFIAFTPPLVEKDDDDRDGWSYEGYLKEPMSYEPDELIGKHVAVFANLKPRKMRFGLSEGMVMASGASDDSVTVLELDSRSKPGEKIS